MNLQICLFVFVLNVLRSRAAPYMNAYLSPERPEFNPGRPEFSPGTVINSGRDFQMGNWSMDYNDTTDFEVDVSPSRELLKKIPGQTTTLTENKQEELFLFIPADEDVCYIKDMDNYEVKGRNDCGDRNDTPIPEQVTLSLPEKCRSNSVKWIDEFYCNKNIYTDSPDVIKALRPFPGHSWICTLESETVRKQTCYCWSCGDPQIEDKTIVCLRSKQINNTLKCKAT